jgi:hypothetical protein
MRASGTPSGRAVRRAGARGAGGRDGGLARGAGGRDGGLAREAGGRDGGLAREAGGRDGGLARGRSYERPRRTRPPRRLASVAD